MHYHGVGHNCDEHSEETEHTENESLCSLCVINIVPPTTGSTIVEVPIVQEDTIFSFYSLIINKSTTSFKPERAPPVVA
jgi:predicted phage tail protein